jgi:hypothetical protein
MTSLGTETTPEFPAAAVTSVEGFEGARDPPVIPAQVLDRPLMGFWQRHRDSAYGHILRPDLVDEAFTHREILDSVERLSRRFIKDPDAISRASIDDPNRAETDTATEMPYQTQHYFHNIEHAGALPADKGFIDVGILSRPRGLQRKPREWLVCAIEVKPAHWGFGGQRVTPAVAQEVDYQIRARANSAVLNLKKFPGREYLFLAAWIGPFFRLYCWKMEGTAAAADPSMRLPGVMRPSDSDLAYRYVRTLARRSLANPWAYILFVRT